VRLSVARCPECGEPPDYILESMLIHFDVASEDGETFAYNGQSQEFVETSEPVKDSDGFITVGCLNGHEWPTTLTEE
jgi:hypothetical protein